jgi:hypothetical protein
VKATLVLIAFAVLGACQPTRSGSTPGPAATRASAAHSTASAATRKGADTRGETARYIDVPQWMHSIAAWTRHYELASIEQLAVAPPARPRPPRPHVGTSALASADRALELNDALDAAAQYRALLAEGAFVPRRYVQLQLARAEIALGRTADAAPRLQSLLALDDEITWPAAYELALVRMDAGQGDLMTIYEALSPRLSEHRGELAWLLLYRAPRDEMRALVAALRRSDMDTRHRCIDELLVFETDPPAGLPSWGLCPTIDRESDLATGVVLSRKQLLELESVLVRWTSRIHRGETGDPARWLRAATELAGVAAAVPEEPTARIASWLALAACHNARVAAGAAGLAYDPATRRAIVGQLHALHRADADRILTDLWRAPHAGRTRSR